MSPASRLSSRPFSNAVRSYFEQNRTANYMTPPRSRVVNKAAECSVDILLWSRHSCPPFLALKRQSTGPFSSDNIFHIILIPTCSDASGSIFSCSLATCMHAKWGELSQGSRDCAGICWDRARSCANPSCFARPYLFSSSTIGRVWLDRSLLPTTENGAISVETAGAGHNREARRTAARHAAGA
jgi:hypothetical protein